MVSSMATVMVPPTIKRVVTLSGALSACLPQAGAAKDLSCRFKASCLPTEN